MTLVATVRDQNDDAIAATVSWSTADASVAKAEMTGQFADPFAGDAAAGVGQ